MATEQSGAIVCSIVYFVEVLAENVFYFATKGQDKEGICLREKLPAVNIDLANFMSSLKVM